MIKPSPRFGDNLGSPRLRRISRRGRGASLASGFALLTCAALVSVAYASAHAAHAARALKASDTAHLHYISAKGSTLIEEGKASGTLPGSMKIRFNVGATFSGSFTIFAHGGTITGHGSATPHGAGVSESFAGSLTVTGGAGRYAHAHGRAGLSGTFNRNSYALSIQTSGTLSY